jgi:hypothetical protein
MGELERALKDSLQKSSQNKSKYYNNFFKTLERELVLWIGSFSHTKIGYESLIC